MLYPKNESPVLSRELFANPTGEYRGAPFWAWNCVLSEPELLRQIDCLREMGFGGFHMHSRDGMATPYLQKEFMELITACVGKAKENGMRAYLYDEDRWPSGAAGGYVTRTPRFRVRTLQFTPESRPEVQLPREKALEQGTDYFLAAYDVQLDDDGSLTGCRRIGREEPAAGDKWYAFCVVDRPSPWYNNSTYIDTLNKEAVDEFIRITYETYKNSVGAEFDKTVPSIFTDEPQFTFKQTLNCSAEKRAVRMAWTPSLPESYQQAYGCDILDTLPEIFWELPGDKPSLTRYRYHDHVTELFATSFADNCGKWCAENGLRLTGHVVNEDWLSGQTCSVGEAMRSYRGFQLPGIDMLCAEYNFATAKQCQSAVHQFGREGMTSELYGVTNYDFDFRGYKLHGDWQACLGVTVRVPHLSWMSMEGNAKRDYPATFNYQSPWHKEYKRVEDHFARLNTVLSRGKTIARVAVVHPIESYWIRFGPGDRTGRERDELQNHFTQVVEGLLQGQIDYDLVSESLLPGLTGTITDRLPVGQMEYTTVLVPGCLNLRRSTFEILRRFRAQGGRLIFVGECPRYVDLEESGELEALYADSQHTDFSFRSLMAALEPERDVRVQDAGGGRPDTILYTLRQDGDTRYLFLCHVHKGDHAFLSDSTDEENYTVTVKGEYAPTVYDTMTGETYPIAYCHERGNTVFCRRMWYHDSLLVRLDKTAVHQRTQIAPLARTVVRTTDFRRPVPFTMEGDNVLLLDQAEWRLDDGDWQPEEEILRLDAVCRKAAGLPSSRDWACQPWVIPPAKPEHRVSLRFTIPAECAVEEVSLGLERSEEAEIVWNGVPLQPQITGYFVDKSIHRLRLGALKPGDNTLQITLPLGARTNTEWCYLLGNFRVQVAGCQKTVVPPRGTLGFGSITAQGLPFYGDNLTYHTEVDTDGGDLEIRVRMYRGELVRVSLDGKDCGVIFMAPYTVSVPGVPAGHHRVDFTLYGNLYNSFGSMHNCGRSTWYGPDHWFSTGDNWCYEYRLKETGILASPVITEYSKE